MPRLQSIDIDPVDVDADGIAQSQTPSGAGNFTLNGALTSGGVYTSADGAARQLSFTSASNESGDTYTVTGTDADGRAQTEAVTGPNATTVESSKYFLTVTQIATSGAATGAITIGVVDELASKTIRLNRHSSTGALLHLDVTGTISCTAQVALVDPDDYTDQEAIPWVSTQDTDLVTASADAVGNLDIHAACFRLLIDSFSSGAEVQAYLSQGYQ
jgi:hypothetical protein